MEPCHPWVDPVGHDNEWARNHPKPPELSLLARLHLRGPPSGLPTSDLLTPIPWAFYPQPSASCYVFSEDPFDTLSAKRPIPCSQAFDQRSSTSYAQNGAFASRPALNAVYPNQPIFNPLANSTGPEILNRSAKSTGPGNIDPVHAKRIDPHSHASPQNPQDGANTKFRGSPMTSRPSPKGSDAPYAHLIRDALLEAPNHQMKLQDIYEWISKNTTKADDCASTGWQNSVRHNLSMNKAFRKILRTTPGEKRKHYVWRLESEAIDQGVEPTTRYRRREDRRRAAAAAALSRDGKPNPLPSSPWMTPLPTTVPPDLRALTPASQFSSPTSVDSAGTSYFSDCIDPWCPQDPYFWQDSTGTLQLH